MNLTVEAIEARSTNTQGAIDVGHNLKNLKLLLFKLLQTPRKSIEPTSVVGERTWGKHLYEDGILLEPTDSLENKIWPLHCMTRLVGSDAQEEVSLEKNIVEMQEVAAR